MFLHPAQIFKKMENKEFEETQKIKSMLKLIPLNFEIELEDLEEIFKK